ncbi:MAG: ABC transporter substrate-binding protein [Dehalococcoidia bacterium]
MSLLASLLARLAASSPVRRPHLVPPRRHVAHLALLVVGMLAVASCGQAGGAGDAAGEPPMDSVVFMAGFRPQANLPFVAAYVAKEQGFFEDERLDVDIQHSSGQDEHLRLLLEGRVQFATGTAAQTLRMAQEGLPAVAVALFGQRGDQGFVARADSGIESPADFAGRTVGFKAGVVPAELDALLRTADLTRDDVQLVSVGFDPREFIEGKVDVYPVFLNNEPNVIRNAGVEVQVFDPHEYGVPTLGVAYLAHRETVREDPDLVGRYLRATLRAVRWIEEDPDAAIDIVLQYAEGADPAHQRFLLDTDLENAARADGIGRATTRQWQELANMLNGLGVLDRPVDARTAFDGSIVERLYEAEAVR